MKNIQQYEGSVIDFALVESARVKHEEYEGDWYSQLLYSAGGKEGKFAWKNNRSAADKGLELFQSYMKGKPSMVSDVMKDVSGFVKDNRNVIYWMAVAFLADHFFFGGAFRERLKACVDKMIGKVETQIAATK